MVKIMPIIRPISELRNNFHRISEYCHKNAEPVYLTKNGKGDLVVMSQALFEEYISLLELYQKMSVAEQQEAENVPCLTHEEVFNRLKERIDAKKL